MGPFVEIASFLGTWRLPSHVNPPLDGAAARKPGPRLCHETDTIRDCFEGPAHTTTIVNVAADIQAESNYMY
jgi:hypothetical protein